MNDIRRVRAHHGMCLCYYRGKGYSNAFADNMWAALHYLQEKNPEVEIVDYDDHICAKCPNLHEGVCESAEKVARYDKGVLEACSITSGTRMHWLEYRTMVIEKILQAGQREKICGDCSWTELCK